MKPLAKHQALPPLLAALQRATAVDGASSLDANVPSTVWRRALVGPAADFLSRPGKQLRTTMVRAGWMFVGRAADDMPDSLPLAIELLHAGSLIVDDVEDDATERRGAPALHRLIGVPLAINTGSWMYFWALAELGSLGFVAEQELAAFRLVTSTLVRCHQGQALDLATSVTDLAIAEIAGVVEATTRLKTGALCRCAAELGALAAGASREQQASVGHVAEQMGIGLQMLDDLGSLASSARRDKAHEDLRSGRPTWPWAWLSEHGPFAWSALQTQARSVIAGTGDVDLLASLLVDRVGERGRECVRATLDAALGELATTAADDLVQLVASELARMEKSYG